MDGAANFAVGNRDRPRLEDVNDVLPDSGVLVLTGAGVSTDSGIPDYRGPGSVPRSPMTYQEFIATPEAHQRYWARAHVGWSKMGTAEPNATHHALAAMQRAGRLHGLITQNIDGLHGSAGHRDVIDLHGRIDRVRCIDCEARTHRAVVQERLDALNPGWTEHAADFAPDGDADLEVTSGFVVAPCEACGGRLKPDVVFFGESVPKPLVEHCFALTESARALLVLGSSLTVMSGLRFVRRAHAKGIPVIIVNRGTTRGDDLATVKLDAGCAETLTTWNSLAEV